MNKKIAKSAFIVILFQIVSKAISFLIEMLTAYNIGASIESDIYYLNYSIYSIISPMISVGIWKVYMPNYRERRVLNRNDDAINITDKLITIFCVIALIIIVTINIFPEKIISIFAPGFNYKNIAVSVPLLRIISFLFFPAVLHTFTSAILQSESKFHKSQFKTITLHIPTLLYLVIFFDNISIYGLALSVLVGEFFTAYIMLILTHEFYSYKFPKNLINDDTIQVLKTVPGACAISVVSQIHLLIDKMFASKLAVGAIICLNYGSKLCHFFEGIFSTAVSTAIFPVLTELIIKGDTKNVNKFISNYLLILWFFIILITSYIIGFSRDVVAILFGRGAFVDSSVIVTANILICYCVSLMGTCCNTIINDILYINKRTNILLFTTIINVSLNALLNLIFVNIYEVIGLAIATSLSLYITLVIKLLIIRNYITIECKVIKNLFALLIAATIGIFVAKFFCSYSNARIIKLIIGFILLTLLYCAIVFIFCKQYRNLLKWGGVILNEILSDRRNNSTRSFIILLFYRLMYRAYIHKKIGLVLYLLVLIRGIVFFF